MPLKINIGYPLTDAPWGGGNQLLRMLRSELVASGNYVENPNQADVVLINSHQFGAGGALLDELEAARRDNPTLKVVHRIDGPVFCIRGGSKTTDRLIFSINKQMADATVFQSNWSYERSIECNFLPTEPSTTIVNTADDTYFFENEVGDMPLTGDGKIRIIATAWAANKRKGFDVYKYLDENLDHDRYQMTFVGNSIGQFRNIAIVPPQDSKSLGEILRRNHVFLTASRNDPCSNSLCEGLACGLPALYLDSGGHPEIVGHGGLSFMGENDVLEKLELLCADLNTFRSSIGKRTSKMVARQYMDFFELVSQKPASVFSWNARSIKRKLAIQSKITRLESSALKAFDSILGDRR